VSPGDQGHGRDWLEAADTWARLLPLPGPKSPTNPDGWLHWAFFDELESEVRGIDGVWKQVRKRNESFDLCVYSVAVYLRLASC